jgi:transcriptional regulator with XRE-family HTH domain
MAGGNSLVGQLRAAIRAAEKRGVSRYRIARLSGVSEGQLSRLMHGSVAPRLDSAERIVHALGRKIVILPVD